VVAGHEVGVGLLDSRLQLGQLALAEIAVRIRRGAALRELPGHGHPGRAQQLAELGKIRLLWRHRDAKRALAGPRVGYSFAIAAFGRTAVTSSLHDCPV